MESYSEYLKSPTWAGIRARIWARDSYKCQCCFAKADCVHHRKYSKQILSGDPSCFHFLISLCNVCHEAIEFNDKGEKISDADHKDHRLDNLMRSKCSTALKDWTSRILGLKRTERMSRRNRKRRKKQPETLGHRPVKQITVHDLARQVESLSHDLRATRLELAKVTRRVFTVRQAVESLVEEFPHMSHLLALTNRGW